MLSDTLQIDYMYLVQLISLLISLCFIFSIHWFGSKISVYVKPLYVWSTWMQPIGGHYCCVSVVVCSLMFVLIWQPFTWPQHHLHGVSLSVCFRDIGQHPQPPKIFYYAEFQTQKIPLYCRSFCFLNWAITVVIFELFLITVWPLSTVSFFCFLNEDSFKVK